MTFRVRAGSRCDEHRNEDGFISKDQTAETRGKIQPFPYKSTALSSLHGDLGGGIYNTGNIPLGQSPPITNSQADMTMTPGVIAVTPEDRSPLPSARAVGTNRIDKRNGRCSTLRNSAKDTCA